MTKKLLLLLLSVLIAAVLALAAHFQRLQIEQSSAPIPTRGRHFTSYRDKMGVAHIAGDSIFDVVYAQGYDHAQQRLFQMDTMRRVITGRLSEVGWMDYSQLIGEKTVPIDKYFRTLGIQHAVTSSMHTITDYQRKLVEAFAAGVNDYALQDMKIHPLEYWLTSSKFEKWEPSDSLVMTKLIHYQMTFDFQFELMREKMAEAVGWDLLEEVLPNKESEFTWGTHAFILNDEELEQSGLLAKGSKTSKQRSQPKSTQEKGKGDEKKQGKEKREAKKGGQGKGKKKAPEGMEYSNENHGSNCWAVHGNHTASGKPMLMGDPHLGNSVPGTWIINELNVKGNYAYGAALPGLPGIFLGKMSEAAWSMTNMGADVADLFYERVEGDQYFYNGTWHKLKERKEVIKVKGGEAVEFIVQSTGHGPLFHEQVESVSYAFLGQVQWDESKTISIQWGAYEHPIDKFQFGTYFAFPERVNTGEKIVQIMHEGYNGFQISVCFVAGNGDIGYIGAVKHPVKGSDTPHRISEGWLPQNDWTDYVPSTDLPYVINPKKGFVSCSNQRVASDKMHFPFASNMCPQARAVTQYNQLEAYIKAGKKITEQDMRDLQFSVKDSFAQDSLPLMLSLLSDPEIRKYQESVKILKEWNIRAQEASIGTTLFYMWENVVLSSLFEDFEFPGGLKEKVSYFRNFMWEQWIMGQLREWTKGKKTQNLICGKKEVKPEGNCVKMIRDAFVKMNQILSDKLGQDKQLWKWGNIHRMHYTHAMSSTPLKPFFHKSFPSLGSKRTLNVAGYYINEDYELDGVYSANFRVLVDMGGDSYYSIDMGNSGIKGSEHYDDFHAIHERGDYAKMEHMEYK